MRLALPNSLVIASMLLLLPMLALLETVMGQQNWTRLVLMETILWRQVLLLPLILLIETWWRLIYSRGWRELTGLALLAMALSCLLPSGVIAIIHIV